MKKRIIIALVTLAVIVAALVGYDLVISPSRTKTANDSASNPTAGASASPSQNKGKKMVLIVYFSRNKGLYDGPAKIGHTKVIADYIQKHTSGDEFEIQPVDDYPDTYQETTDRAQREQKENARPRIKNPLPDVSKYDTVFIGGPIWWGEYPMIVRTFMDSVDLNGKTVIPFTTHGGSGLGNTKQQLEKQYPQATVPDGFAVSGTEVDGARDSVDKWLTGLGY